MPLRLSSWIVCEALHCCTEAALCRMQHRSWNMSLSIWFVSSTGVCRHEPQVRDLRHSASCQTSSGTLHAGTARLCLPRTRLSLMQSKSACASRTASRHCSLLGPGAPAIRGQGTLSLSCTSLEATSVSSTCVKFMLCSWYNRGEARQPPWGPGLLNCSAHSVRCTQSNLLSLGPTLVPATLRAKQLPTHA